jgi:hypothetical protein
MIYYFAFSYYFLIIFLKKPFIAGKVIKLKIAKDETNWNPNVKQFKMTCGKACKVLD